MAFFPQGGRSRIQSGGFGTGRDTFNFDYSFEQKYNFRYRVERVSSGDLQYSARVWVDGSAEPTTWNVQYIDETTGLTNGSVLLIGHYTDVTFGDVTVVPVSTGFPVAVPDSYTLSFETPRVVSADNGLLANDSGGSGALTAVLDSGLSSVGSSLTLNADGSFEYIPATGFSGIDTFTYFITDGQSNSNSVQVSLEVLDSNADSDLLAHLPFDDSQSPGTAVDISGLGNDGVISGATYVFESGDGSPSSLDFDPGDSVSLGGLDVNGTEVTLAAWVKADSFTGPNFDGRIISKADALAANRHIFMLATRIVNGTDAELQGRVRIGGQTATFRARSGAMVPGVWYHTAKVTPG